MKKVLFLLALLPSLALAQTYNLFKPANGVLKGATTTYVTTTANGVDVAAAFSGVCDITTFLRGDGACAVVAGATGANPTASAGLTAVNGSAATFMRSDGAPALDLTIVPGVSTPWTGSPWVWSNAEPRLGLNESDQGSNLKLWDFDLQAGVLTGRTRTDADGAGLNWIAITRGTTTNITSLALGNTTSNPTTTLLGTGLFTAGNGLFTVSSSGTVTNATTLLSATAPSMRWNESDQGTDLKNWNINVNGAVMTLCTATDAASGTCVKNAMTVVRGSTTAIGSQTFGNATDNPTFTFLGTGAVTASGAALLPGLASSSAAQTGTLCWTTGTGNITVDTTTTCLLSTRRVKKDIAPLDAGLAEVMALQPVSYELKPEHDPGHLGRQVGLISEDVGVIDPRLISHEADGTPLGVRYQQLTAVLVKAIQEQQQEIMDLQRRLDKGH